MSERTQIKNIVNRMKRKVYAENNSYIEFEGDGYETIVIEFDDEGYVTAIYS